MTLTGPERQAHSGEARSLLILLHGYGADGNDLIGLADVLAPHLPHTRFLAPNAPERCVNNPMGYQWFPIPRMDGSSEQASRESFAASVRLLDGWLDEVEERTGIPPARTALLGFSQGTMMSLHVGLRRRAALAGICGFSGRLLAPDLLGAEIVTRPPVLLIHGDEDPVVPFSSLAEAEAGLTGAGVAVETHVSPGVGHGIAPDGLTRALGFLQGVLE
ncbi:phospholipase [Paroceanicella profunda]|uniref:Phospholipase n=1 Tax=Paroceanicella profunda TaxID=2579971 RepID=A0A5B8FHV6_9RHOB|nr:dienelactone hydrolase family protein [Paroceanicella profunda]QDL92647.1 phospholipase [Paroceanicella profunda]